MTEPVKVAVVVLPPEVALTIDAVGDAVTFIVSTLVAVRPPASVIVMVGVYVPPTVGVPVIAPVEALILNQAGAAPVTEYV